MTLGAAKMTLERWDDTGTHGFLVILRQAQDDNGSAQDDSGPLISIQEFAEFL